jgi:hypothetical protein
VFLHGSNDFIFSAARLPAALAGHFFHSLLLLIPTAYTVWAYHEYIRRGQV